MKYQFQLSKLAILDLENIFTYTIEKWSIIQAENYYNFIQEEIKAICENPLIGKSIEEIKVGSRYKLAKSHYIIYKVIDDMIFIDRVLHQKMDIVEILGE